MPKTYTGEKIAFSTIHAGKTEYWFEKLKNANEVDPFLSLVQKSYQPRSKMLMRDLDLEN